MAWRDKTQISAMTADAQTSNSGSERRCPDLEDQRLGMRYVTFQAGPRRSTALTGEGFQIHDQTDVCGNLLGHLHIGCQQGYGWPDLQPIRRVRSLHDQTVCSTEVKGICEFHLAVSLISAGGPGLRPMS
jgi:hypothetical protein